MRSSLLVAVIACSISGPAWAQGIGECDGALIKATYNSFASDKVDWRLASQVTENLYNEIKHDADANAVIYGIPVGASYSDFKKTVDQRSNTLNTSLTHDQALNIMWTGLEPNAANAYTACLDAYARTTRGLHAAVKWATLGDIAILVSWVPQGHDPNTINVHWAPQSIGGHPLPKQVTAGDRIIVVPRPHKELTLAANYPGFADAVILEPLPSPPPQPQPPSQMSCGTLVPNLGATAFSDVPPGKGFDPKTFSQTSPVSVPAGTTTRLSSTGSEYHNNGGGEAGASIDTSCNILQQDSDRMRAVLTLSIHLTGLSGHCCSGFGPGGSAIAQPDWESTTLLPGFSGHQKWTLAVASNATNTIPTLTCFFVLDGNPTAIPLPGNQSSSFTLSSGSQQLGMHCTASQPLNVRPGAWDSRQNVGTDITLSLDASRI